VSASGNHRIHEAVSALSIEVRIESGLSSTGAREFWRDGRLHHSLDVEHVTRTAHAPAKTKHISGVHRASTHALPHGSMHDTFGNSRRMIRTRMAWSSRRAALSPAPIESAMSFQYRDAAI
jgi:hypothetical protein